jgi:hypothetical protein
VRRAGDIRYGMQLERQGAIEQVFHRHAKAAAAQTGKRAEMVQRQHKGNTAIVTLLDAADLIPEG